MKTNKKFQELENEISKGLKEAYKKMIHFKKYKNTPVIVSKNGKIIEMNAADIPLGKMK